jgi:hypothetical protein
MVLVDSMLETRRSIQERRKKKGKLQRKAQGVMKAKMVISKGLANLIMQ